MNSNKFSYHTCKINYIGETSRMIRHKIKEHKWALNLGDVLYSSIAEVALKRNHEDTSTNAYNKCLKNWYKMGRRRILSKDLLFVITFN